MIVRKGKVEIGNSGLRPPILEDVPMKHWAGILFLVAGGVTASCDRSTAPTHPVVEKVGQVYPNYAFPSLEDGRPVALSSFRGKKVILHHFASW